jgi:hypothetical protein
MKKITLEAGKKVRQESFCESSPRVRYEDVVETGLRI